MRITTSTLSHPRGPVQSAAPKHNTPANVARRRPTNNATIGHAPSDTSPSGCQSKRAYPIGHQSQTDVKGGNNRMRGETLTDRQQEVLDKIREHIERTGLPPSRSELAGSLGLAHASAVKHHLHALEKKGWLEVKPGVYRGIYLLYEGTPVFDPRALPTVPAGTPALADESAAVVRVPDGVSRLIHPQADFYLVVHGDSMDRVGYRSNDIVAVKRNPEPSEGDVVIARLGHEITLKCFHRAGRDRIELQPRSSNPEHRPIVIDGTTADWEIVGVVVGAMIGARPTTGC